jgi:hypothetical protein
MVNERARWSRGPRASDIAGREARQHRRDGRREGGKGQWQQREEKRIATRTTKSQLVYILRE